MVLSLLACRPNHARHVGAGRALVCDQPIRVLQGQNSCHFPQCVLAPRARKATLSSWCRPPPSNPYASTLTGDNTPRSQRFVAIPCMCEYSSSKFLTVELT